LHSQKGTYNLLNILLLFGCYSVTEFLDRSTNYMA